MFPKRLCTWSLKHTCQGNTRHVNALLTFSPGTLRIVQAKHRHPPEAPPVLKESSSHPLQCQECQPAEISRVVMGVAGGASMRSCSCRTSGAAARPPHGACAGSRRAATAAAAAATAAGAAAAAAAEALRLAQCSGSAAQPGQCVGPFFVVCSVHYCCVGRLLKLATVVKARSQTSLI